MPCLIYQTVHAPGVSLQRIRRLTELALRRLHAPRADVAVHFVGDRRMRTLNRRYRGMDRSTDVLSFSPREGNGTTDQNDWGDIFLSVPYIRRQAKAFGVSYEEECVRMLIHGLLHLAGLDHDTRGRADRMFGIQERLVKEAGYTRTPPNLP